MSLKERLLLIVSSTVVFLLPSLTRILLHNRNTDKQVFQRPPLFICDNSSNGFGPNQRFWVPDVIHLLRFGSYPFEFVDAAQIRSIYLYHGPERIRIHTNNVSNLQGKYWDIVKDIPGIEIVQTTVSMQTRWEHNFSSLHHACDVKRMEILQKEGGIYLDRDVLLLRPLRWFFKYEFVADYDRYSVSSQVLISQPKARYGKLFLNSYKNYKPHEWYYNAGQLPLQIIVTPHWHLVHKLGYEGGVNEPALRDMYDVNIDLENIFYAVHYYYRMKEYWVANEKLHPKILVPDVVRNYSCSLGRAYRKLFFGTPNLVSKDAQILSTRQLVRLFGYPPGAKRPYPGDAHLVPPYPTTTARLHKRLGYN